MAGLWMLYGISFIIGFMILGLLLADYLYRKKHHSH